MTKGDKGVIKMDGQLSGYRADFCDYVYELLQDDMDNTRANAIIDLYDELLDVTEKLERENFGMKSTINNIKERLEKTYY